MWSPDAWIPGNCDFIQYINEVWYYIDTKWSYIMLHCIINLCENKKITVHILNVLRSFYKG
jgi:hypothetical protein